MGKDKEHEDQFLADVANYPGAKDKANLNDLKICSESLRLEYVNYCSFMADACRSSIFVDMDFLPDCSQKHEVYYWKEGFSFVVQFMKNQLKIDFAPPVRVYISGRPPDLQDVAVAVRDALGDILKLGDDSISFGPHLGSDDQLNIQISCETTPQA